MTQAQYFTFVPSPVGLLKLTASDNGITALEWETPRYALHWENAAQADGHPLLVKAKTQLGEYFAGKRQRFDLPLAPRGTVFQMKTWAELQKIPYGGTISYAEQAKRLGDAKKARAVGAANGRNPISIIVPCHRVIGMSGALTGFGGGLKIKEFLLEHEKKHAVQESLAPLRASA